MSRNFELLRKVQSPEPLLAALDFPPGEAPAVQRPSLGPLPAPSEPPDWQRVLAAVRRNWRWGAGFALLVVAAAASFTYTARPVYEPSARIEVDPPGAEEFSLRAGTAGATGDPDYVETQGQNLQSDDLAIAVIRKLKLDTNPEFAGPPQASVTTGGPADERNTHLTPAENGTLRSFRDHLRVRRESGTRLFTVSFSSYDPEVAAKVVNTVARMFIENRFAKRHQAIVEQSQWLSRQLDDVRDRRDESNQALLAFQRETGIAELDEDKSTFTQQMSDLSHQLTQAQADRIQFQSYMNQVRSGDLDLLPQIRGNPVVQALTEKTAELQGDLSQASIIYGANHPNTRKLRMQIEELQRQLELQRKSIVGELRTNLAAAERREQLLGGQMHGANVQLSQAARYLALKKEAQTDTDLYNSLYARIKEAAIAAASGSNNIRVVDEARVLDRPTRPNRSMNLAAGLFAGLIGGVLLAAFKDSVGGKLHDADDIKKWTGMSAVTMVPAFSSLNGHAYSVNLLKRHILPRHNSRIDRPVSDKVLLDRPHSPEAEALRGLETSIMLSNRTRPPQMLLVTSSFAGEGKTTVAMNLAIALAQHGTTCLVDADLRNPSLGRKFGLHHEFGIAEMLGGEVTLDDVLKEQDGKAKLTVLPAGVCSVNAAQLICSEPARELLLCLRQRFRFVVIDTPPVLPYADGRALSPLVDGVIFVGRAGVTARAALVRSMELLAEVHSAPVLDVVVNAAHQATAGYYGY